jgi:hypothetical protein
MVDRLKAASLWCLAMGFIFLTSCATYYEKSLAFQEHFVRGDMERANVILDKNKKAAQNKDRLLYFWQKGVVLQHLGRYEESNEYFEQAYFFTEDYRKTWTEEATSLLINAAMKPYTGEDHELVLMHYYKALNFLQMNQLDEALVECRRINIKLNALNDRYAKKKNRYRNDAFALNLMGIIYEAAQDVNNAFIAYRNALNVYEEDYLPNFGTPIPEQLKTDLLRTAYLNGFREELAFYENKFNRQYVHRPAPEAELVFFWHNGMGPVKGEWSINFFLVEGQAGMVVFASHELGMHFPFELPPRERRHELGDLRFVRAAFPKYLERRPFYRGAELVVRGQDYLLEPAENVNKIAFQTLNDRMIRELGTSLLRLAIKQATEQKVREKNENLGVLLSTINALSEKADTRNWQVLPYQISYARVPLEEGANKVSLQLFSPVNSQTESIPFSFPALRGETLFHMYHSIESLPLTEFFP